MIKTNSFITSNQNAMYEFLDKLSDVNIDDILNNQLEPHITEESLVTSMDFLATSIKRMTVKLGKYFGEQNKEYFDSVIASLDEYNKVAADVKANPKPKQQRPVSPPPLVITAKAQARPVSPLPQSKKEKEPTPSKKKPSKEAHLAIWGQYDEKSKSKKDEDEEPEEYEKVIYFDTPSRNKSVGEMDKSELADKQKELEQEVTNLTNQLKGKL